jgi:hypothetical protein
MPELTRELFISLWQHGKAGHAPDDAELARMQKFMLMHDDMHEHFERFASDPATSMEVEGENLMLHIAMDAATEKSLEFDQPAGARALMQSLLDAGMDPGKAFHVLSQAMMHTFLIAADQGNETDENEYLARAKTYAQQALAGSGAG